MSRNVESGVTISVRSLGETRSRAYPGGRTVRVTGTRWGEFPIRRPLIRTVALYEPDSRPDTFTERVILTASSGPSEMPAEGVRESHAAFSEVPKAISRSSEFQTRRV